VPRRLSRPARLGRWFIGLYVGYVLLANVLIRTPLLQTLIHAPQRAVRLDWKDARSFWPGYVHMQGVRVDITDGRYIQVEIGLDTADPVVDLMALTRREFHLFKINANGASLRMRVLRGPDDVMPPEGELPPMVGYPDPPRYATRERDGQIGNAWRIRADAADVDNLREVWIDRVRFQGLAHPIGPFEVLPGRTVAVGPADVEVINGSVSMGGEERAANVWGQVHAWLHKLTHAEMGGLIFARELDADVKLTCEGTGLGFLEGPLAPFKLARGNGLVSADVQLVGGVIQAGSHVRAESPEAVAGLEAYEARGPVHVDWLVSADKDGAPRSHVRASVAPLRLWMVGYDKVLLTARALQLHGTTGPLDLADLKLDAHVDASLVEGRVPDLRPFMEQLGAAGFVLRKGGAEAQVHFTLDEHGRGHGEAKIETDKLEGQILGLPMETKAVLALKMAAFDVRAKTADLAGTMLYITAFRASTLEDETGWWTTIGFEKLKVAMAGQLRLDAALGIEARDARPLLEPLWDKSQLPEAIRRVVRLSVSKMNTRLAVAGKDVELGPFAIHIAGTDVLGRLRKGPLGRSGSLLARTGPLSLGLQVLPAGFDTHFIGAEAWYRERMAMPSLIPPEPPAKPGR
jgi:hypothetical protein